MAEIDCDLLVLHCYENSCWEQEGEPPHCLTTTTNIFTVLFHIWEEDQETLW